MISFITPTYNQIDFIKAWCEFTTSISDDVIVCDTGSTDGTIEIVEKYPIKLLHHKVERKYTWDEGLIRNKLTDAARLPWVYFLDTDELLGDNFRAALPELIKTNKHFIWFLHYSFWLSPNLIRVRQFPPLHYWRHFYPCWRVKMYRKCHEVRWKLVGNHAPLELFGLGRSSPRLSRRVVDIPYYHYHHCIGARGLQNRAEDYRKNGIKTITYWGEHPKEVKFYDWWGDSLLFPTKNKEWEELR